MSKATGPDDGGWHSVIPRRRAKNRQTRKGMKEPEWRWRERRQRWPEPGGKAELTLSEGGFSA